MGDMHVSQIFYCVRQVSQLRRCTESALSSGQRKIHAIAVVIVGGPIWGVRVLTLSGL